MYKIDKNLLPEYFSKETYQYINLQPEIRKITVILNVDSNYISYSCYNDWNALADLGGGGYGEYNPYPFSKFKN